MSWPTPGLLFVTVGDEGTGTASVRMDRIEAVTEFAVVTLSGQSYELGAEQSREQLLTTMAEIVNAARPR